MDINVYTTEGMNGDSCMDKDQKMVDVGKKLNEYTHSQPTWPGYWLVPPVQACPPISSNQYSQKMSSRLQHINVEKYLTNVFQNGTFFHT